MVSRVALLKYLDGLLQPAGFRDYVPNGLQVEGRDDIKHIVSGVTASLALVEAACEVGADALIVHHGYFWKGENPCVSGIKKRRLQRLLAENINLFAYHLPLDAHHEVGNNRQLADQLDLAITATPDADGLVWQGELSAPMRGDQLAQHIEERLGRKPLHLAGQAKKIHRVAWCTGAAQGYIDKAVEMGVDAFISGEVSEQTMHWVRETGIHYYSAGHHATERYGVKALGEKIAAEFGVEHKFIDISNPV